MLLGVKSSGADENDFEFISANRRCKIRGCVASSTPAQACDSTLRWIWFSSCDQAEPLHTGFHYTSANCSQGGALIRYFIMVATSTIKTKNTDCVSDLVARRCDPACMGKVTPTYPGMHLEFIVKLDQNLTSGTTAWHPTPPPTGTASEDDAACARQLAKTFEDCLSRAKKTTLHCSAVLVPEKLTWRIARDVLRLVSGEPCGLRGCVLYVYLELDEGVRQLERIACDATVVPTFELTLVFKQDCGGGWLSLRELFMGACFFTPGFHRPIKLSPGFRLVKRKLYSSAAAGTVVVEC
ncbi:DNA damage-inducible transcript 4-like protein [Merluccius polli]|uniref:DNA damage-inducible transcript 4-like protein n=1 Tax=Merluccius polli TaxID=89951 RepID=A0AA47P2Y7_MERPO|nr:DNA damage-inducible transcript 4-like protein [Merluccius polli]